MGTDCRLYDGKKWCDLDRWYVFSSEFKSTQPVERSQVISRLQKLLAAVKPPFCQKDYSDHWVTVALEFSKASASTELTFYDEHDDPGYEYDLEESLNSIEPSRPMAEGLNEMASNILQRCMDEEMKAVK